MANDTSLPQRVLVTGAGTGIGTGIAQQFAKQGAAVALHYSRSAEGARNAAAQIRDAGGNAKAFGADFNDIDAIRALAVEATDFLGGIDVLVNNAGITMNMSLEETTPEQFDTLFNVNIRAMFFLTQAVTPTMAKQGNGVVINLASVHAYAGMHEHATYAATKGAIVAFTRTVSLELARKGIRVNCIAPGGVLVDNWYKAMPDFNPDDLANRLPCGFLARPEEIGRIAVFLASDAARYILGQTLIVDGGQTAIMPLAGDALPDKGIQFGKGYVPGVE
jgi:3-oxoacyl-[acyl-carrier protein] reductase